MEIYHFVFLALVLPGFISHYVYTDLGQHKKAQSQLQEVIQSLLYSIITMIITYYCFIKQDFEIYTFNDLTKWFSKINFAFYYLSITILVSIFVGYLSNVIHDGIYLSIINLIRKWQGKNKLYKVDTIIKEKFDDGKYHALKIENFDNKLLGKGFFSSQCYYDNSKEFVLGVPELIDNNKDCFTKNDIKCIYFDLNGNIKITEYKLDKFGKKFNLPSGTFDCMSKGQIGLNFYEIFKTEKIQASDTEYIKILKEAIIKKLETNELPELENTKTIKLSEAKITESINKTE